MSSTMKEYTDSLEERAQAEATVGRMQELISQVANMLADDEWRRVEIKKGDIGAALHMSRTGGSKPGTSPPRPVSLEGWPTADEIRKAISRAKQAAMTANQMYNNLPASERSAAKAPPPIS